MFYEILWIYLQIKDFKFVDARKVINRFDVDAIIEAVECFIKV